MTAGQNQEAKLNVADQEALRRELSMDIEAAKANTAEHDPELDQKADELVKTVLSFSMDSDDEKNNVVGAVGDYGLELQKKSASQSAMLKNPLKKISKRAEDGGEVANALIDLKITVEDLDPASFNFDPGWFTRMLGMLPGIGDPLRRYFSKYESAQTVINAIISSLEKGREQLSRDNVTLKEDQKRMRELTKQIERAVKVGQLMDHKIEYALERELASDEAKSKFVKEEILFPLRQRIMDLQQQLAVNQQGVLAAEVLIRNNQELIRGVNRALNVTVSALEIAVTVAMALADQKIVLDKINALSETTNNLIAGTAERLKTQGAAIHKQAASTQLDIGTLTKAFEDIQIAMEDISRFRIEALPKMAESIIQMEELTTKSEEAIVKLEKGNKVGPQFKLDI